MVENSPLDLLGDVHQSLFNHLFAQETWERSFVEETRIRLSLMVDGAMHIHIQSYWVPKQGNPPAAW